MSGNGGIDSRRLCLEIDIHGAENDPRVIEFSKIVENQEVDSV